MPNYTGVFMDQSADVEVDVAPEELEEVAESEVYPNLHLARAQSAPDIEFMTIPLMSGQSLKILSYDAARTRAIFACDSPGLFVSALNLSGVMSSFQLGTGVAGLTNPIPGFIIPDLGSGQIPFAFNTQSELWVFNGNSQTQRVWYSVERYSER